MDYNIKLSYKSVLKIKKVKILRTTSINTKHIFISFFFQYGYLLYIFFLNFKRIIR